MNLNEVIVKQSILYGHPCVLFKHSGGYAWSYKGEVKDLGDISKEAAIKKFDWNF